MPVQSTCPECGMTLTMSKSASGSLKCPICDTVCAVPKSRAVAAVPRRLPPPPVAPLPVASLPVASLPVPDIAVPRSNRRKVVLGFFGAMAAIWLGAGVVAAVFFLRGDKSSTSRSPGPQAQAGSAGPVAVVVATQAVTLPPPPDRPPPDRPPPLLLTEEQKKINAAIDQGVAFLKPELKRAADQRKPLVGTGAFYGAGSLGSMALMGLTLLECGVAADDESLQKTADEIRSAAPNLNHTYTIAVSILFLDRLGDKRDHELIRSLALRLIAGQTHSGSWTYICQELPAADEKALNSFLEVQVNEEIKATHPVDPRDLSPRLQQNPLVAAALGKPAPERKGISGDNSNAQFAILALWVARRHGVPVQPTLALADRHFRDTQADDGSWSYLDRGAGRRRASMTCAGLLALAVGRSAVLKADKDKKPEKDAAIEKGFRFLVPHIGASGPRQHSQGGRIIFAESWGDLYYLWSLERVAMVYDLKIIGGKDWYAWASKVLVDAQMANGSWHDAFGPQIDTCFALLVLKRVNVAQDLTVEVKKTLNLKDIAGGRD